MKLRIVGALVSPVTSLFILIQNYHQHDNDDITNPINDNPAIRKPYLTLQHSFIMIL